MALPSSFHRGRSQAGAVTEGVRSAVASVVVSTSVVACCCCPSDDLANMEAGVGGLSSLLLSSSGANRIQIREAFSP